MQFIYRTTRRVFVQFYLICEKVSINTETPARHSKNSTPELLNAKCFPSLKFQQKPEQPFSKEIPFSKRHQTLGSNLKQE